MLDHNTKNSSPTTPNSSSRVGSPDLSSFLEGGFKLASLEIFNWGTFDGKIWKIQADGQGALITGENGSGKSTLVDGILTLLVANNKRNYNLSSGSGKRERSESTYVRGAYGRKMEELGVAKTKFCREEGKSYTVLLAQFQNEVYHDTITLAQFFWYEKGELKKYYISSNKPLTIETHFSEFHTPADLKKRLKLMPGTQIFDSFNDYQLHFLSHMGPKSLKAMDLFNQVVAIKEVANLSDFVRKHMLEAQNVQDLIDQLYANYENLNLSHQAILQARSQLEILSPLGESAKELNSLKTKQEEVEQEEKKIPLYFSLQRNKKLNELIKTTESEQSQKSAELKRLQQELASLQERKAQLSNILSLDSSGQEIEKIQILIKQVEEQRNQRHHHFNHYETLLKKLNLTPKVDLKSFTLNKEKTKDLLLSFEAEIQTLSQKHYELRRNIDNFEKQTQQITEDIQLLKKSKGNIPSPLLKLRDMLCTELGISSSELPFVAELIQVKSSEHKIWNLAIEKVLKSYALRLLVPSVYYAKINKYLSKNSIGTKLIYNKVDLEDTKRTYKNNSLLSLLEQDSAQGETLISKLEFHSRSQLTPWLKNQLNHDYDYLCTEDLSLFQSSSKAIMPSGLIKRSTILHEKDDRFDSQNFQLLLGWDNTAKLNQLQNHYSQTKQSLTKLHQEQQGLDKRITEIQELKLVARDLLQIENFSSIDWTHSLKEIETLQSQKDKMSRGNLAQIQKELDHLNQEEHSLQSLRDQRLSEIAVLQSQIKRWPEEIQMTQKIIDQIQFITKWDLDQEGLFKYIEAYIKKNKIHLFSMSADAFTLLQREISEQNLKDKRELEQKINALQLSLIKKMTQFKIKFSETTTDLQASIEYLPEFLKLLTKLESESLPEHEKRFKTLLNKSVVNDMAAFKSTLELAYDEISESVAQLNESLKKIPFSETTHVQLYLARSKDVEIREFNNLLKNALKIKSETSENKELKNIDLEESFSQIKKILDRLKKDLNWCKTVTDVRNWADFYVLEHNNADDTQKNYYADSAGLSGGQKAKLAFTILASALAYQYGLHKVNAADKSFRFVVIDEAFSKSDEKNSRYAMDLFISLGLQLFVVTPKDKIHVVEPYIKNIFLTHINEQMNDSKVTTLTIDEFHQAH